MCVGLPPCRSHRLDEILREVPARIVLRDDVATQDQMAGQTAVEILDILGFDRGLGGIQVQFVPDLLVRPLGLVADAPWS